MGIRCCDKGCQFGKEMYTNLKTLPEEENTTGRIPLAKYWAQCSPVA